MSILQHFPWTPRPQQVEILETLEAEWNNYDVFVVGAPVAVGKSPVAVALASWREEQNESTAIITHNNVLVNQYLDSFPSLPALHRKGHYGGDYNFTLARDKATKSNTILANYYTYAANRLWKRNLVIDEAHNVLSMLRDRWAKKLWQRTWAFPDEMETFEDFLSWAETVRRPEMDEVVRAVVEEQTYVLEYTVDTWRGNEDRVLKLIPLTVRHQRPWLWNRSVRKIVLMSATISEWEIYELGLDRKRVLYLTVTSPIPPANRPIILDPVANMSWASRSFGVDRIASRLVEDLETRGGKGVIHATYDTASRLRARLGSHPRLIWHSRADKQRKYREFLDSPESSGLVFVASGFNEGIDLAYGAARWQTVCEIPYLNLSDPAVRVKQARQPDWYRWEAVKTLRQTVGRVSRAPDDYGETWIYDSRAPDLINTTRDMWSQDELNSMRYKT